MSPHFRLLLSFAGTILLIACLLIVALTSHPRSNEDIGTGPHLPLRSFFSFRDPASLFFPTATISLTDDNSTSFNAKPAAFGPLLPDKGLSGQVWIGYGFGSANNANTRGLKRQREGELGCGDLPGWNDKKWALQSPEEGLVESLRKRIFRSKPKAITIERDQGWHESGQTNEQFIREAREIRGKIALLSRGGCGFSEKIEWAQRRGASAVIVGDNVPGSPLIRMYPRGDVSNISIPSVFTSHTTAHLLSSLIPGQQSSRQQNGPRSFSVPNPQPSETLQPPLPTQPHEGLWVTLILTDMNASPFFNTLFVLVVSPLITLAVVYSMLLLRSRIRRRRWRAPKSVVDRLPVRVYRTLSSRTSPADSETSSLHECASNTPLLSGSRPQTIARQAPTGQLNATTVSSYGSIDSSSAEQEKVDAGLSYWRRKYGGKQRECVVCLEEYIDGVSRVMSLPCGHEFHADCITPWLTTRRRTCPICKGDVVRSIDRMSTSTRSSPREESEEEIQAQAAELTNSSPSAALPIPYGGHVVDSEAEEPRDSILSFSDGGSPPSWSYENDDVDEGVDPHPQR